MGHFILKKLIELEKIPFKEGNLFLAQIVLAGTCLVCFDTFYRSAIAPSFFISFFPLLSSGLKCFIAYFETVNTNEHRIHRSGSSLVVDKTELIGMPYLWQLVLKSPYGNIAEEATQYLIDVSFSWLSNKLKKVKPFSFLGYKDFSCSVKLLNYPPFWKQIYESIEAISCANRTFASIIVEVI